VSGDRGAGSVLAVGIIGATVLLCGAALPLYAVLVARSSVTAAADAAALAAADVRVGAVGGFPCDVAAEVAAANGAVLVDCELDGYVATVSAHRQVLGFAVTARATAGPSPENTD